MKDSLARSLGVHRQPSHIYLCGLSKDILNSTEKITVVIQLENIALEIDFHIVQDNEIRYDAIVGRDAITSRDIMFVTTYEGTSITRRSQSSVKYGLVYNLEEVINVCVTQAPNEAQNDLRELLNKHAGLIASKNNIRQIKTAKMLIRTTTTEPVVYHPYRMSASERTRVQEIVIELLNNNIIRESISPYASPVILMKKRKKRFNR